MQTSVRLMRTRPIVLLAGAILCLISGRAGATTIIQSATFGPAMTDWTHTFTFDQFNPSLGTLNSVIVTSIETLDSEGILTNSAAIPESFDFTETFQARVTLPDATKLISTSYLPMVTYTGLAPGASVAYGPYTGVVGSTAGRTYTNAADLAAYIGTGTVTFAGSTLTSQSVAGGGGNIKFALTTTAQDAVTVAYDYTPSSQTPEPFTLALSGAGFIIIGLLGRKRLGQR